MNLPQASANRTLLALLKRFQAVSLMMREKVLALDLGTPQEEQALRMDRRLQELDVLQRRTHKALLGPLFRELTRSETTAAGLTQVAAPPNWLPRAGD